MEIELKKLGEITTGNTPSKKDDSYWDSEDICFVKPDGIADKGITLINDSSEYISENARSKARVVSKDAVFVTCIGSIGKIGIASSGDYAFNQQINVIEPNEKVLPRYLAYNLLYSKPRLEVIANAPVVPIINKTQFGDFKLNIEEDRAKQFEIVSVLDKLTGIIESRKKELESFDELIKARFVELFGDESQYDREPLSANVQEMFIGPFGSALKNECFVNEEDSFCMVYEQKHAIQKTMNVPTRYVDEEKYNELKRFTVVGGDVIVSCRGTIGEIYSVPEDAPIGIMHPSIMKIRLKKDKYCNLFFVHMLEQYMQENTVKANGSGIKMAVTATDLGKELFVVPSIEDQKAFENFVKQVDKSKVGGEMNYLKIFLQGFIASLPSIVAVVGIVVNNHRASGRMKNDRLVKYKLDNINELLNYFNEVQILYMEIMSSYKIELLNVSKNILDGKFDTRESNFMDNCYLLEKKALLMAVYKNSILKSMNISIMSDEIAEYIVGFVRKITMYHFMIEHITKSYIVSYYKTGDVDESRKELIEKLTYEKDFSVKTKGLTNKQRIELAERIQHYFGIYTTEESELKLDMVLDISVDAKKRIKNAIDYIVYDYCDEIEKNEKTEILDEYERNVAEEIMRLMK